jgi:predicted methyltransferase
MIKIHDVNKGEGYFTITFSDVKDAYGVIIRLVEDKPMYVEFMKFTANGQDIVSVIEDEKPEEFNELKVRYLDHILDYITKLGK